MYRPHAHVQDHMPKQAILKRHMQWWISSYEKVNVEKESREVHLVLLVASACSMHAKQRRPMFSVQWFHGDDLVLQIKFSIVK
jgi:hypothetical protein